jgi:hypothetical protein
MFEEITSVLETKNRNVNSTFQQMANYAAAMLLARQACGGNARLRRQRTPAAATHDKNSPPDIL